MKKPKVLIIIGLYLILSYLYGIIVLSRIAFSFLSNGVFFKLLFYSIIFVSFIDIIAGIGLILIKEWARKLEVALCWIRFGYGIIDIVLKIYIFFATKTSPIFKELINGAVDMVVIFSILIYLTSPETAKLISDYAHYKNKQ